MHKPLRLALLVAAIYSGGVLAQAKALDIPAQPLAGALTSLASQSGIQLLFNADELKGARAPALRGNLSADEALRQLLAGSGFSFASTGKGTFVVQKRAAQGGDPVLSEVLVRAEAERGYKAEKATVAGKVPLAPREIANSVSVLTREQMDDQGVVVMPEALLQVTGINVITNDTLNAQYFARGYGLGVMYDGVTSYNGMTPSHQFDLNLYERIEVLRGPAGLLRGVGEPGGVVNLVKKKPKDSFGLSWSAGFGSWDNYRLEGDLTGPLNTDKSLRGRLVVAEENRGYFYDHTHSQKWLAMGALEYDLTPQTLLSLSFTAQDAEVKAPWSGIPTSNVIDGNGHYQLLDVRQSTFNVPDWGRLLYRMEETAASVEHRFDNKWIAKASLNHRQWRQYYKYAYASSSVNTTTGRVDYASMQGDSDYNRDGVDLFANGPFELFGRTHNLLLGANAERYEYSTKSGSGPNYTNVLFSQGSSLAEPSITYIRGSENETLQYGLYSQLRLSLADPLTLVLGGRTTNFTNRFHNVAPAVPKPWTDGAKANDHFTPYAGLLFDLNKQITLYGSYADIFVPQTQQKFGGGVLDPRVGKQYEIGSKGEFLDGKLAASLALFNIRDKNRAYQDLVVDPSGNSYLNAGEVESKGWELEVSGKPLRGLDLIAGYTHLNTRYLSDPDNRGKSFSIQTPKDQLKFWGTYHFAGESPLAGFTVGLGMIAQGKAQSSRGWRDEVVNDGYVVFNGKLAYQIDRNYSLNLAINNLFNEKYYASVGTPNNYNFYGEPRSYMLTLRASY